MTPGQSKAPLLVLFVTLFTSVLGLSILFPVLGPLGRQLHLREDQVGLLTTVYAATQFLAAPFWGRLSEKRGRRPILLVGLFGFSLSFVLLSILVELGTRGVVTGNTLWALLIGARVVGGTFASATFPTAQALAADLSSESERTRAMAIVGGAFGMGIIIGPLLGGACAAMFSLSTPLWVASGIAIGNLVWAFFAIKEPSRSLSRPKEAPFQKVFVSIWPLLLVAAVTSIASVSMEQTISFAIQDRLTLSNRNTASVVGYGLGLYGVFAVLAQGYIARKAKVAPRVLVLIGLPVTVLGMLLLIGADQHWQFLLALALQGLGNGLALPGVSGLISVNTDPYSQGKALGLNSSAQSLGRLIGPALGTLLYRLNSDLPFEVGASLLAVALVLFLVQARSEKSKSRSSTVPLVTPEGLDASEDLA